MTAHHPETDPYALGSLDEGEDQEYHPTGEAVNTDLTIAALGGKMDAYFGQIHGFFKKQDASQTTVARLTSQKDYYKDRVRNLQDKLNKYEDKIKTLCNEREELRQKYSESLDEVDKLQKEKMKLRNVILKQTGTEKISDEEVKKMFTSIRQKIQAIAHSKAFHLRRNVTFPPQYPPEVHQFWDCWNTLSITDRAFFMRAKIFKLVVDHVLEQNLFGISPTNGHDLQKIESSLKALETFMTHSQVPADAVVDWRHATMKAIEQTKINHDGCISEVESMILRDFGCLIPRDVNNVTFQKLHDDIHNMCKEAYELRFLMRKSKANYTCEAIDNGANVHDHEVGLEVHGVLNGGDESSRVAFTICGALIKSSENGDMEPVVLERAHVVVNHV